MSPYFVIALVLIVGSIALRNTIGDTWLSIAIGIGVAFVVAGLFNLPGRRSGRPQDENRL